MKVAPYQRNLREPDGFRIITVGTGAPHYDSSRASACTLIQYKDTSIIVDLGYGSMGRMLNAGLDAFQIPNVLFSHCLHVDHTLDYGYYLAMGMGNGKPLNLYGPPGTAKLHNNYMEFYEDQLRIGKSLNGGKEINVCELKDGDTFSIGPVSVEVCEVPHIVQNYAYKFSAGSQSVVVTGDMCFCEHFIPFAKDADAVVFDANTAPSEFMEEMAAKRPPGKDNGKRPGGNAHAELEEIADMTKRANIKSLILTHFTRNPDLKTTNERIASIYKGKVIMGEDMLTVTL